MKAINTILAYALMAGVTLGITHVPHAIFYEYPHLMLARRENILD